MLGDNITFNCSTKWHNTDAQLNWNTDIRGMLDYNNININKSIITIKNIMAKNSGTYTCSKVSIKRKPNQTLELFKYC